MNTASSLSTQSVHIDSPMAVHDFDKIFSKYLTTYFTSQYSDLIIMCIGTDRSTGDSLGPLIGYKLEKSMKRYKNIFVKGTLEEPVHAKNIKDSINLVYKNYDRPFIIAIDACLGKLERVGFVSVGQGSLSPGSGVNKVLPSVGDIYIKGIVNLGGFMEYIILQNTRLSTVMKMADLIAEGIRYSMWKFFKNTEKEWSTLH